MVGLRRTAFLLGLSALIGCAAEDPPRDGQTLEGDGLGGQSQLLQLFREGEARFGVPAQILAAVSYAETRLRFVDPAAEAGHGAAPAIGLMALSTGGVRDAASAAELASLPLAEVLVDPRANVLGGAALLADLAGPDADWRGALDAYGALDQVETYLARGYRGLDAERRWLVQSARPLSAEPTTPEGVGSTRHELGYPNSIWNPACSCNYSADSRGKDQINYVVIHTTQGSYAGAISWFKNPAAEVSAHYVVRSSDGQRTHMVDDSDRAWHDKCFNTNSIGIEHEGYVADPDTWYTEAMYIKSAELTAWLCDNYTIPKDRAHIMGHGEAPDCTDHTDPGSGWNWTHYMELVQMGGAPRFEAQAMAQDAPTRMESGEQLEVWYEFKNDSNVTWGLDATRLGTADPQDRESPFYLDGNWLSPTRATGADQSDYAPGSTGRFTFSIVAPEVTEPTTFVESYQLVQEGDTPTWFGPVVTMTIEVVPQGTDDVGDGDGEKPDETPTEPQGSPDLAGGCSVPGAEGSSGAGIAWLLLVGATLAGRRRRRAV